MKRQGFILRLALVSGLGGAFAWLALHHEFLQAAKLEKELGRFGPAAPILFILLYALATVLFVPGSVLTVIGGALFGPLWGTLWNLTGAAFGATVAFLVARYVGSDWVAKRTGERLASLMRGVEEEGWRFVAFVRLVPLFPFNLVNYAFGLTRIRLSEYLLASFLCMAPGTLAYTYLGYAGSEAASGQAGSIHKALLALALLATVALLPRLLRRLRRERYTDAASLANRLQRGEKVELLDVRTPEEFRGSLGHIAGATNIPITDLARRLLELGQIDGPIVTIWSTEKRSVSAAKMLAAAGFGNVFVLRGGMENWNKAGYPVEKRWTVESGITMKAQVSVYPLRREHLSPAVEAVRKKLEAYGLFPAVGAISTDISGEAEAVFAALRDAFVQVAADGQVVMSITVSNACPR